MKLTKCFLVASAAFMASALMSNVPNHKNEVFKASILDTNVRLMVERLHKKLHIILIIKNLNYMYMINQQFMQCVTVAIQ